MIKIYLLFVVVVDTSLQSQILINHQWLASEGGVHTSACYL